MLCRGSDKDYSNFYISLTIQSLELCIEDAIVRRTRLNVSLEYGVQHNLPTTICSSER